MTTLSKENSIHSQEDSQIQVGVRDNYLPVPISFIPPQALNDITLYQHDETIGMKVFVDKSESYSSDQKELLIKNDVAYLYIDLEDYNDYLKAVSSYISKIFESPYSPLSEKAEIAYAILLASAKKIMTAELSSDTFDEILDICSALAPTFAKHTDIYNFISKVKLSDYDHAVHSANVSVTLTAFAGKIGIKSKKTLSQCCAGGLLLDFGKRFIPTEILDASEKLSDADLKILQSHVSEAINGIKQHTKIHKNIADIINQHHETIDGTGYPNGLKAKEISVFGKTASIVDIYEALICRRPYRDKIYSPEQAVIVINSLAGSKLDRIIAGSFVQFVECLVNNKETTSRQYDALILNELKILPEVEDNPLDAGIKGITLELKSRFVKL